MIGNNKILFFIVLFPIIEILLFIEVGGLIGSFMTISLTLLTAIFGIYLLKIGTFINLNNIQEKIKSGNMPDREIQKSIFNVVSAICLIIPGILTDSVGILLLMRPIQFQIITMMMRNRPDFSPRRDKKTIIDVEHKNNDD
tara:strand:- start:2024 stop:2446 length:423 start_codon:yes stop_codon:yes gene_type:complete